MLSFKRISSISLYFSSCSDTLKTAPLTFYIQMEEAVMSLCSTLLQTLIFNRGSSAFDYFQRLFLWLGVHLLLLV